MSIYYQKGRYLCRVTDQALGKASTGTKQFLLKFLVLKAIIGPEEYQEIPAQYERTSYNYITEKTIDRFMQDLAALGFTGQSFKDLDPNSSNCHDFRGTEVEMYCGEDKNQNGEPRERWSVAKQGGIEIDPLDAKEVRDLDNLFGKQLKAASKPSGTASKPAARQSQSAQAPQRSAAVTDDDVPF